MKVTDKIVFIDYEGTISENPKGSNEDGSATLHDLLFGNVFEVAPIQKMQRLLEKV